MIDHRAIAEPNTILRALVGSSVHGLAVSDGLEDRDEMGVCIEPREYVIGLRRFEHWVHRTQPDGVRSKAGDLDLVVYSLRKWARLALQGNPTVLLLLFARESDLVVRTPLGDALRELAPAFASRAHGRPFLGYMTQQRLRIEENKGGRPNRPELVERYGYDTKFAMHMLRLGHQGAEYLRTGRITLPVPEPERSHLRSVRLGEVSLAGALAEARDLEAELNRLMLHGSPLPPEPDFGRVERFVIEAYETWWGRD